MQEPKERHRNRTVVGFATIAVVLLSPEFRIVMSRPAQHHEMLLIGNRKRTEQHGIDGAEDRCVGADAKRQRENCNQRKSRRFRQHAHGIAQVPCGIAPVVFHALAPVHLPSKPLADPLHCDQISKPAFRFLPGGIRLPTLRNQILRLGLDMKAKFIAHVRGYVRPEKTVEAAPNRNRLHLSSSRSGGCTAPSTFATAAAYASHVFTSWRRCLRPAVVSE